ncbi:MAG: hypothetical protein QXI32_02755 [Candidatus Bathyarchaeia archaeon]
MATKARGFLAALMANCFLNMIVSSAQSSGQDLNYVLSLLGNPSVLLIFGIELLLGLALGYFSIKALKYVASIILILILGMILNIWQSPNILRTVQEHLGVGMSQLWSISLSLIYAFGLTTILPVTLGFIIGIILAIVR